MTFEQAKLTTKLTIDQGVVNFLGDKRIRLLEAIDLHGSINKASKAVPLSYKAAWEAVDEMNNLAPHPVVVRTTGGRHGGGTSLTAYGRSLIAFYRALEQESQGAIELLRGNLGQVNALDATGLRQVLRRITMRTSARNQFAGPVIAIKEGIVDSEVTILVDAALTLTAVVTRESTEKMGLAIGSEALALVKASSILLLVEEQGQISARNRYQGTVSNIHAGPVNAEVTLSLPGGHHVITGVITQESVKRLCLEVGSAVTAVFKASSVFLVALD